MARPGPKIQDPVTRCDFEDLKTKVTKISGFNLKISSFEKKLEDCLIRTKILENEIKMLRRIVENNSKKTSEFWLRRSKNKKKVKDGKDNRIN